MAQILEILAKMNPWWSGNDFDTGLTRELYLKKINSYMKTREIVILAGVRRSGKTTLMFQAISHLIRHDRISQKQVLFVNFDEPDIANLDNPIGDIIKTYEEDVVGDGPSYLFFDEVQNVKGWERWAKTIYDQKRHKLIISGYSSGLLDSRLAALISGRYLRINVFPLDFREYLNFNKIEGIEDKAGMAAGKARIMKLLKSYLAEGGFPRVVLENNPNFKNEFLKTYYESIVYKDIISMHEVRHTKIMKEIIYYLCSNFTGLYSYKKLGEMLKADFMTIKEYLSYIEESRMLFEIHLFSYSLKMQSRNNKKVYCIDNGLRNAVSFKFSEDMGKLAENMVFVELKRRGKETYYWRDKGEVDFVIKNRDRSLDAMNVSYGEEIDGREIKSLLEFKAAFKKTGKLTLLTKDVEKKEKGINFIPLWKYLLKG